MTDRPSFYVTTPIYYVNDKPHIGHAYTSLACDVLARFKRLDGYDVKFLTGTDEHGQKVEKSAEKAGMSPQDFTDQVSQHFRNLTGAMNFSNDDFIRTTEPRHIKAAQAVWNRLTEKGHIYLGSYAGWYSVRDEAFYTEAELVDGNAPTGAPVEWVEEPSYFFNLSQWQDQLLEYYTDNLDFIAPESRRNEVIQFVRGGLKDLSVSRTSFKWGVPTPGDEDHIMYVWLDALTNYLSALGFPDTESSDYETYWPADVHVVGKDILRFHAVYWPAFLMAADLPLPKRVMAHGWWTNEGQKISKSIGNVIDPFQLIEEFGLDQTRYYLMREVPFGNDGNFSRQSMISRINGELANKVGNLAQRSLSMIQKHCDAKVPTLSIDTIKEETQVPFFKQCMAEMANIGDKAINEGFAPAYKYFLSIADRTNEKMADYARTVGKHAQVSPKAASLTPFFEDNPKEVLARCQEAIDEQDFSRVLEIILELADNANGYIDQEAPWELRKTNPDKMQLVLYVLAEKIRHIALLLQPFVPQAASHLLDLLAVPEDQRNFTYLDLSHSLKSGTDLPAPTPAFPRFNDELRDAS